MSALRLATDEQRKAYVEEHAMSPVPPQPPNLMELLTTLYNKMIQHEGNKNNAFFQRATQSLSSLFKSTSKLIMIFTHGLLVMCSLNLFFEESANKL